MKSTIHRLMQLFTKKEKKKLLLLLLLMIIAALFETIGIGLIVPFVGIVLNPDMIQEQPLLASIYTFFSFETTKGFIIFAVLFLLTVFVLKNFYLLGYHYIQFRIILNQQVRLSQQLFKAYLMKPYVFHIERNSAELLRNVNGEVNRVFSGIVISSFQLLTEMLVIACIGILLFLSAPIAMLTALILISGSCFLFFHLFRNKIQHLGEELQHVNGEMIKWVHQGLAASKEVKVSGKEAFFIRGYTNHSQIAVNNSRTMRMLELTPRLFIETLLVSIVLITMLIIVFQGKEMVELVSTMALFAMAAFRLMPSITKVLALITTIKYSQPALKVVLEDLNRDSELYQPITADLRIAPGDKVFESAIQLKGVSFRYPNQREYAIKEMSLTIPIGRSVGIIGESGAGKTTLVDLLLGLFVPDKGKIEVDGVELKEQLALWQQKVGYIPQHIFLSDDTIRNNVAFGLAKEEIEDREVWRALEQAQLKTFVENLPNKLDTMVGERGVRLSGGQRQRIGIARALYHHPEILFMDEATSALDQETEKEVMKAIEGLKGQKTIIIIAHRLTTIENCDIVFKLKNGRLHSVNNKMGDAMAAGIVKEGVT